MSIYRDLYEENKDKIAELEEKYKQLLKINEANALSYVKYRNKYTDEIKELRSKVEQLNKEAYKFEQYQTSINTRLTYIYTQLNRIILNDIEYTAYLNEVKHIIAETISLID